MKGGLAATEDMFKPKCIENWYNKPKKKDEEEEDDLTPKQREYKKQQAFISKLYWHEGDGGRAAGRECKCVYGETRHYARPKKIRYYSAARNKKSKEIWERLTRPKSAAAGGRKRYNNWL